MKTRNILAFVLALLVVVSLFSACASEEPTPSGGNTPSGGSAPAGNPNNGNPTPGQPDDGSEEELVEIEMWWPITQGAGVDEAGTKVMEEAFNAITEEKLNVHVNFTWIASADYMTQLSLAVSNGESVDIMNITPGNFSNYFANGVLMDITDLMESEGSEMLAMFGDLIKGVTVNGRIYSVPSYRNLATSHYLVFRKEQLEAVNMVDFAANEMDTWAELEQVFAAIVQNGEMLAVGGNNNGVTNMAPSFLCGTKFADCVAFDTLGDTLFAVCAIPETGEVSSTWERPEMVEQFKLLNKWAEAGYIYTDMLYVTGQTGQTGVKEGLFASFFVDGEGHSVKPNNTNAFGTEAMPVEIYPHLITTASVRKFNIAVPASSENPEAAIRVIQELYTNADLITLFCYGVAGVHHVVNDDGTLSYFEGKDAMSCGYRGPAFWGGNAFLLPSWDTEGPGYWDYAMELFKKGTISPYAGLAVDISNATNLVTALSAVKAEYYGQLNTGFYSDQIYEEFIAKAKSAGLDEYVALYADAVADFAG